MFSNIIKIGITTLGVIFTISSTNKIEAINEHLYPLSDMYECDNSSRFKSYTLKDFSNNSFKVQWSDEAGELCPGDGFPRIVVKHPEVSEYVHFIVTNQETPKELLNDISWNPLGVEAPWIFLDLSDDARSKKHLFYNNVSSSLFHDNPKWGGLYPSGLIWRGRLYGVKKIDENHYEPVFALEWGFDIKDGHITPYAPKQLEKGQWLLDVALLTKITNKWNSTKRFL